MASLANLTVLASVLAICLNAEQTPRSALYATSWSQIRKAMDQFERDVQIEILRLNFDNEDWQHFTQTKKEWDATHRDEDGDVIPRPAYDAPGVFPADSAAQRVWDVNNQQHAAFRQIPNLMAQSLRLAMGPVIHRQYQSSPFNLRDGFEYANMKAFLHDKFHVKMKQQLLKDGMKAVNAKMGAMDSMYDHNLRFNAAVEDHDEIRGEQQSRADRCITYRNTLSNNPLAQAILTQTYFGGIFRAADGSDYTDPSTHTVESMQQCLQLHINNHTQVSAPFAAAVDSNHDALVAAITAQVTANLTKQMRLPPPASGGGQHVRGPKGTPPAPAPMKPGTVYCQWCGYYAPGKTYAYKTHPTPHTGATCPNLNNAAWRTINKPTAQQKAATSHCDCNGMWTGEQAARA